MTNMHSKQRLFARIGSIALLACLPALGMTAGGTMELDEAHNDVANKASLQRGARNFMNYCAGCHSATYVRYNRLGEDLGLSDEQLIDNLMFNADKTHETINVAMRADDAERWFGQTPPDLSLIGRSKGSDYLYTFLRSFYVDPSTETGFNNTLKKNVSMPHVLWQLDGLKVPAAHADDTHAAAADAPAEHGAAPVEASRYDVVTAGTLSPAEYDIFVRDIVNFLDYIGEPMQLQRQRMGVWVMVFLLVLLMLSVMLKKEIWKDVD